VAQAVKPLRHGFLGCQLVNYGEPITRRRPMAQSGLAA